MRAFYKSQEIRAEIDGLRISGYQGSFDVEIIGPPEAVWQEYRQGREFIEMILDEPDALGS